jgi:hypothetical protein
VLVVRAQRPDVTITCAGEPMVAASNPAPAAGSRGAAGDGIVLGKRYSGGGVEVMCVVAGAGPLAVDGNEMAMQEARALPSSD